MMEDLSKYTYLYDGVYAQYDGMHVILITTDGIQILERIYLDKLCVSELISFIEKAHNVKIAVKRNAVAK